MIAKAEMILLCTCALVLTSSTLAIKRIPTMPAGIYMTSPNEFIGGNLADTDAPICRQYEPCGFYTFESNTRRPKKWIPSWCKCKEGQECIYSGQNNRMKIYVHSCAETEPL